MMDSRNNSKSQFKRLYPIRENKNRGPDARSGHRIVVNDRDLYCYGGYNPTDHIGGETPTHRNMDEFPMFRELWKFNIASKQWQKLATTGAIPRESASYACLLLHDQLLVFGGTGFPFAEVRSNLLYCCNLKTLVWRVLKCVGHHPSKVYGHAMLYLDGYIYLFGGTTGFIYNNDMYRLDLSKLEWKLLCQPRVEDSAPLPRYRHEMATDGRYLYVFGGGTSITAEALDVVWAFDILTNQWLSIGTKPDATHGFPAARKCHGCVQQDVFVTGGLGDINRPAYKDVWRFNMSTKEWKRLDITLRKEVYFHATAMAENGAMYTFGGVLTRRQENKRSRALYKVDLGAKNLTEICWDKLLSCVVVSDLTSTQLLALGVPHRFVSRLDFTKSTPDDIVASAS